MRTNTPKVGDDLEVDGEAFPQQNNEGMGAKISTFSQLEPTVN